MLRYIGGGAFQPPYPARDLSDDEVEKFGESALLATGLYSKSTPLSVNTPTSPQIEGHDLGGKKLKDKESKS